MNVDVLIGEILTLSMMAFALGMDAFSVGLGMGMAKLKRNQVFQIGVIIGLFHVIMPLGGMIAGQFLSGALGALAGYIGGALLLVLGIQMIVASFNKSGEQIISPHGFGLFVFAVGVSLIWSKKSSRLSLKNMRLCLCLRLSMAFPAIKSTITINRWMRA